MARVTDPTVDLTHASDDILRYEEAFESYIRRIEAQREARRAEHRLRKHWQTAAARLTNLIGTFTEDDDPALLQELRGCLLVFQSHLAALDAAPAAAAVSAPTAAPAAATAAVPAPLAPATIPAPPTATVAAPAAAPAPVAAEPEPEPEAAPAPQPIDPAELAAEAEQRAAAIRQTMDALRTDFEDAERQFEALLESGLTRADGSLHAPNAYRLRILACDLRAIIERAGSWQPERVVAADALDLIDRMSMARTTAADVGDCLPFDYGSVPPADPAITAAGWRSLRSRYARMPAVQEAWEWLQMEDRFVVGAARTELIEAISAGQQLLYRGLVEHRAFDKLQEQIYRSIDDRCGSVLYLRSRRADTTDRDLEALVFGLKAALKTATDGVEDERGRQEKRDRKASTKQVVLDAVKSAAYEALDIAGRRDMLVPMLREAMAAGVPYSDKDLRHALVHDGLEALEDLPEFARLREQIVTHRLSMRLDVPKPTTMPEPEPAPEPNVSDQMLDEMRTLVRTYTTGKRLMLLGGVRKQKTCDDLQRDLALREAVWASSKKSDNASKFEADIRKSDILIVLKNLAGHDMSEKGREWIREQHGDFIMLRQGCSVSQVIAHLHTFLTQGAAAVRNGS